MVEALLRALGFDDETDAGAGQDRAPVGSGQDVPEDVTQARQRSVRGAADQWIGTPYHLGGNDQKSVDCSGLVTALLRGFGANLPGRPTTGTYRSQLATPIPWESIQPGDVLISPANRADPVSGEHMALYVGGGQMAEATGPEGAPARYSSVTSRNLQPYRMREQVPGLQQVTLMAQRDAGVSGAPAQGASAGQAGSTPIDLSSNEAFIQTAYPYLARVERTLGIPAAAMAGIAINEGVTAPGAIAHDQGAVFGVKSTGQDAQGNDVHTGLPVTWQNAWEVRGGQNVREPSAFIQFPDAPASILGFVDFLQRNPRYAPALAAARRGTTPREFTQLLADAGYATDPNWTGKVLRGAQQAEQMVAQGRVNQPSDAGTANAGGQPNLLQQAFAQAGPAIEQLRAQIQGAAGAVGEHIAGLGATPAHAAPASAGPPPGPTPQVQQPPPDAEQQTRDAAAARETATAQGRQQAVSAAPGAVNAVLNQPVLSWRGGPQAPPAAAATAPPDGGAPAEYPGGFAAAASAAAGPARPIVQPSGAPPTDIPRGPAAGAPVPPESTGPPPAQAGLPPDTADQHWDNSILAWVPKTPPSDFGPGGGHYRLAAGVTPATDPTVGINGGPAPNPPGTPVEYVPNQSGYYETPQGRMFYDAATQQFHQPTGQAAQGQGAQTHDLGGGLRFLQPDPKSPNGTWLWTDPGSGVTRSAPGSLADQTPPAGLQQPTQTPMTEYQQAELGQRATAQTLPYTTMTAYEAAQVAQRQSESGLPYTTMTQYEAAQLSQRRAEQDRSYTDVTANTAAELASRREAEQMPYTTMTQYQTADLAQRQATEQMPYEKMTAYQQSQADQAQATADERAREFGTLSADQQARQQQEQASLAQSESQFQQSLAEKQSEAQLPYQQMTKAQQAQTGIQQQELGLKQAQASNQLESLPRGGIMRVNPFTGQSSLINAPEPEDIRMVGSQILIPGGRQVSMLGQQISGGPNPYAGWGGGGGGWGGGGGYGWQPPQQQRQGWMGSGY